MRAQALWTHRWIYDWNGANLAIFHTINGALPDNLLWMPEALTWLGSYWLAPAVLALMLAAAKFMDRGKSIRETHSMATFALGLVLALGFGALAKHVLAFPRPSEVLGQVVYRASSPPDSRYSFPSGHSLYVAVLAASIWPAVRWRGRVCLLLFAAAVGWSRVALGAHFPADVVAGFAFGWAGVAIARPLALRLGRRGFEAPS